MKRLTVLRHAKSRWNDPGTSDFNRPLNDRGRIAARRIGRLLQDGGYGFDLVLASPAARVRETIDAVEEEFSFESPIQFEHRLYLASEELLLTSLRGLPEACSAPLLVGHNPGLQQLLVKLSTDDDAGLRGQVARVFPTSALAILKLPARRWSTVEPASGTITGLILSADLD